MASLLEQALNELDVIVFEEYGGNYALSLLEADNEDGVLSTPFSRAASFPARAIRYKKAKSVMNKYEKKILSKIDKIIDKFEGEINKSIPQITKRGEDLQRQLEVAKKSGGDVEAKSIVNQQKKFNEDVKKSQDSRVNTLNQTIENLITTYTTAIHKRIDEPGYVLKVEISDKGKADLKFIWEEKVAAIKQQAYEKLVRIINNKNIKSLESLVSRLEVEIEKAEDERRRFRSSYRSTGSWSSLSKSSEERSATGETKPSPNGESGETKPSPKGESEYEKLKKYLDEELPEGILEEDEAYKYAKNGGKLYDLYFEIDDSEEKIIAVFFEDGANIDDSDPIKEYEIKDTKDIDDIVDRIQKGKETELYVERDYKFKKYESILFDHLTTLFKTREKYIKDVFDSSFYNEYSNSKELKQFVKYMVGKIVDHPGDYQKQEKILANGSLSDRHMLNLFLVKFYQSYSKDKETKNESFISLEEYKKLYS